MVLTVNHVYSPMVTAVTAAKSQPNFQDYWSDKFGNEETVRTKIPQTIVISRAVGTTWNTMDDKMKEIPLNA